LPIFFLFFGKIFILCYNLFNGSYLKILVL